MRIRNHHSKPVETRQGDLILVSRAVTIKPDRFPLVLTWNRPAGVLVRDRHGAEEWLPVKDHTRRAQLAFLIVALLSALLAWRGRKG